MDAAQKAISVMGEMGWKSPGRGKLTVPSVLIYDLSIKPINRTSWNNHLSPIVDNWQLSFTSILTGSNV